jgi:hypothetical protein
LKDAVRLPNLALGMRQCLGLFPPLVTHGLGLAASDYTFAITVRNIAWGGRGRPDSIEALLFIPLPQQVHSHE